MFCVCVRACVCARARARVHERVSMCVIILYMLIYLFITTTPVKCDKYKVLQKIRPARFRQMDTYIYSQLYITLSKLDRK